MNKPCVFIPCLALLLTIVGCDSWKSRGPDTEATAALNKGDDGRVELLRDRWGVPHVFARTDAGGVHRDRKSVV